MFLPSLLVSPLIGMFLDGGDLNREEILLRLPKFIRLFNSLIRFTAPRVPLIFPSRRPRRPRLPWPLISTNAVLNIGAPPPLSRLTILAISSILLFTRLKYFEGIERGIQDFLALGVSVPPVPLPLRFALLCLQCSRICCSRFSSNFASRSFASRLCSPQFIFQSSWNVLFSGRFRRSVRSPGTQILHASIFTHISNVKGRHEHRPDHLLRQPRCRRRVLYRRPRLLHRASGCGAGRLRVRLRESVVDAAMHVVHEPQSAITRPIAPHGQGRRRGRPRRPSGRQGVVHAGTTLPSLVSRGTIDLISGSGGNFANFI